jgi:hypothetical protein
MEYKIGQYLFSKKQETVFKIIDVRYTAKGNLYVCEWPSGRADGSKITSYYANRLDNEAEVVDKAKIKNYLTIYGRS